jgi:hypothetical protein
MVGEWREYRVGEIADIVGGSTPSLVTRPNFDEDIPWNTPKDLSAPHERYESRGERNLSPKGLERATPGRRGAEGAGQGRGARLRKGGGSRSSPSRSCQQSCLLGFTPQFPPLPGTSTLSRADPYT